MRKREMPLGFLETGKNATICKVMGACGLRTKLNEMGFALGTTVQTVRNDGAGPVVISVMDSRIALGRGMAQKILVQEI